MWPVPSFLIGLLLIYGVSGVISPHPMFGSGPCEATGSTGARLMMMINILINIAREGARELVHGP